MTNIEEIWKDIPNYEGLYQVSNLGRVKSFRFSRLLTPLFDGRRHYYQVVLCNGVRKSFKIHQLVAMAFLNHTPCGFNLVVNHKNLIKTDNRLDNLEIVSHRENTNKKHLPHSSKYTGVYWCKSKKRWISRMMINGKSKHLGSFTNEYDAHLAYENKKQLL